jgi:hypothetical protein
MAIKGKGKTKRRGVGAAPKPVYVKPKRPILARKGFWIIVGSIALAAIVISVVSAILVHNGNKHKAATRAAEAAIVRNFGTQIDNALAQVGQGTSLTSFQALPDLSAAITDLQSGKLSAKAAIKQAAADKAKAASALAAVQNIKGSSMISGHTDALNNLVIGQNQLASGLQLYEQVADSLKLSAEATGRLQKQLFAHTAGLLLTANQVFQGGYEALVGERAKFGLVSLSPQSQPPSTGGSVPGNLPPTP